MGKAVQFLTSELKGWSLDIYRKVQDEAKKKDRQLLCYCCGPFHESDGNSSPRSKIYNFINTNMIEGIIINGGALGQFSPTSF